MKLLSFMKPNEVFLLQKSWSFVLLNLQFSDMFKVSNKKQYISNFGKSEFGVLSEFVVFLLFDYLIFFLKERFLEILVFEGVFELHVLVQKNKKLSCRAYHLTKCDIRGLFLTCLFALVDLDLFHTLIVITCWERCF